MTPFPLSFLAQIMQGALFQPATNYWRAIELTVLIEKGLPFLKDARSVFDLGCGDGEIMRLLRPHLPAQAAIAGMDIDPAETAMAEQSGVYACVLCGSADSVPLPSESQDAIISNSVLEHVAPIEGVLRESGRLLKQGGWFVATVPAPDFHACLKGSWQRGVSHADYCREMDKRLVHHRYWTRDEWAAQLAQAGLTLMECLPYLSKEETRRWEFLSRITGGMLYHLTKGRQRPIVIQRQLGVRKSMQAPLWVAQLIAWVVTLGMKTSSFDQNAPQSCFLVIGRKA